MIKDQTFPWTSPVSDGTIHGYKRPLSLNLLLKNPQNLHQILDLYREVSHEIEIEREREWLTSQGVLQRWSQEYDQAWLWWHQALESYHRRRHCEAEIRRYSSFFCSLLCLFSLLLSLFLSLLEFWLYNVKMIITKEHETGETRGTNSLTTTLVYESPCWYFFFFFSFFLCRQLYGYIS